MRLSSKKLARIGERFWLETGNARSGGSSDARPEEHLADAPGPVLGLGGDPGRVAFAGQGGWDPIDAVDPADLLDDVLGDLDVQPEHRREDGPGAVVEDAEVETEAAQDRLRLLQRHMHAEQGVNLLGIDPDPDRLLRPRVDGDPL